MKDILPYLKPYRRRIALGMLLVAAATVCDLLLPTIMNDILNNGVRQSDFAYIVRCCAWMLAVAAAGLAALLAGRKISCDVVAGFNADLRTDVFSLVNNMTSRNSTPSALPRSCPGRPTISERSPGSRR